MTVKELIEELQKCNPDCEVDIFDKTTGTILTVLSVDGEGMLRTIYLNAKVV